MAGGGWSKSSGRRGSLSERGIITPPDGTSVGPGATVEPGTTGQSVHEPRHCWVDDPPGFPGRWPGVVAQWRRGTQGWEGRAVVVIRDPGPVVLDVWLPASQLTQA